MHTVDFDERFYGGDILSFAELDPVYGHILRASISAALVALRIDEYGKRNFGKRAARVRMTSI